MSYTFNPFIGDLDYYETTGTTIPDWGADTTINLGMDVKYDSGASGTLTITIRSADGSALSSTNKGYAAFRRPEAAPTSTTNTETLYTLQEITSNLTYVIDNGDTFGIATNKTDTLHVYLIYDLTNGIGIAVQCGLSTNSNDRSNIIISATPRTARFGLYAVKGLSSVGTNVAIRTFGYFKILEATPGTWTQDPTGIFLYQQDVTDEYGLLYGSYKKTTAQAIATGLGAPTIVDYNSSNLRTGFSATTGASWSGIITTGGSALIYARVTFQSTADISGDAAWTAGTTIRLWLYIDGSARHVLDQYTVPIDNLSTATFEGRITLQGNGEYTQFKPSTTFDIRVEHNDAVSHNILDDGDYNLVGVARWNYAAG